MTTDYLDEIIIAKQTLSKRRRAQTPELAVMALADMQMRPHPLLNVVTEADHITLIGQVRLRDTYDPVAAALKAARAGLDGISLLTDTRIYSKGMEDLLLVSRGVRRLPVICQDYVLDEYGLLEVRAAGASGVILYASLLGFENLRNVVSLSHRLKMNTIININEIGQLDMIEPASPHAISVGGGHDFIAVRDLPLLREVRANLPYNVRLLPQGCIRSLADLEAVMSIGVNAVMLAETLIQTPGKVQQLTQIANRHFGG